MLATRPRMLAGAWALALLLSRGATTAAAEPDAPGLAWVSAVRWLQAPAPTPARLRGRVVLVEFWTFDCINCRRTVPAMRRLAAEAAPDSNLIVLGIHTPELPQERETAQVRRAVEELDLRFPIAQDNAYVAWKAFGNAYWPCLYLLDRSGRIRWRHIGELHLGTPAWTEVHEAIASLERRR